MTVSQTTEPVSAPEVPARTNTLQPWHRVAFAMFAIGWGGNEFTPLLGMYRELDGLNEVHVDLLLASYVLGIIPALLIGGPASDRFGRRPLLVPAPLIAILGSLLLAAGNGSMGVMFVGRLLCGVSLGLAMAVGSSWVAELSVAPYEKSADASPARRASLALTAGFGLGAALAALLAQFGPMQTVLPYALDIVITAAAYVAIRPAPETRVRRSASGPLLADLRVPTARHWRFGHFVLPCAPWVFGCAAAGYAVLPSLITRELGSYGVGFAGLACLICLGCGFAIQPLGRRLDREGGPVSLTIGMLIVAVGMGCAAVSALVLSVWLVVVTAAVLGCGYGLVLVASLQELQHIAGVDDLAGLTAVFYSLAYLGFFVPMALAEISHWAAYQAMFAFGVVAAFASLAIVLRGRLRLRGLERAAA